MEYKQDKQRQKRVELVLGGCEKAWNIFTRSSVRSFYLIEWSTHFR